MFVIAYAVVCDVKFLNSFARCRHLFDVAAIQDDVDSNFLSDHAPAVASSRGDKRGAVASQPSLDPIFRFLQIW